MEQHYLHMAVESPGMLCSEATAEILEAAASEAEPTKFMEEFFATGHLQWLAQHYGRKVHLGKDQLNNAIVVLWLRACRLNTCRLLGRTDEDWDKPFFSDEGLYE